jgi:hypothetical protein
MVEEEDVWWWAGGLEGWSLDLPHCRWVLLASSSLQSIMGLGDSLNCSVPAVSRLGKVQSTSNDTISSITLTFPVYIADPVTSVSNQTRSLLTRIHLHLPRSVSCMNPRSSGRSSRSKHFGRIALGVGQLGSSGPGQKDSRRTC